MARRINEESFEDFERRTRRGDYHADRLDIVAALDESLPGMEGHDVMFAIPGTQTTIYGTIERRANRFGVAFAESFFDLTDVPLLTVDSEFGVIQGEPN